MVAAAVVGMSAVVVLVVGLAAVGMAAVMVVGMAVGMGLTMKGVGMVVMDCAGWLLGGTGESTGCPSCNKESP
jgi:hypothetical protein